jgi:3alpha(or 20beta)-hydroxysteroid dehydrogenase
MDRLKGKVILISGGARGQGAAEARLFTAEGARVVIGDVLEAEGRRLASELGPAAAFLRQDAAEERDWQAAIDMAATFGGLNGLVNNAGIYRPATLMETDAELFERHFRVNQLGCFLGMKAVAPPMERSGGGSIVNISSVAGLRGSPGAIAYGATKWALRGMTKAAAIDPEQQVVVVETAHAAGSGLANSGLNTGSVFMLSHWPAGNRRRQSRRDHRRRAPEPRSPHPLRWP